MPPFPPLGWWSPCGPAAPMPALRCCRRAAPLTGASPRCSRADAPASSSAAPSSPNQDSWWSPRSRWATIDALTEQLSAQVRGQSSFRYADYLPDAVDDLVDPPSPVLDVSDETSARRGIRVVCTLRPRADVGQAERWVRSLWPAMIEVDCRLPAPMRRRLLGWDRRDGSGLAALRPLVRDSWN